MLAQLKKMTNHIVVKLGHRIPIKYIFDHLLNRIWKYMKINF